MGYTRGEQYVKQNSTLGVLLRHVSHGEPCESFYVVEEQEVGGFKSGVFVMKTFLIDQLKMIFSRGRQKK